MPKLQILDIDIDGPKMFEPVEFSNPIDSVTKISKPVCKSIRQSPLTNIQMFDVGRVHKDGSEDDLLLRAGFIAIRRPCFPVGKAQFFEAIFD